MIDTPISWPGALVALAAALAVPSQSARWPEPSPRAQASMRAGVVGRAASVMPAPTAPASGELSRDDELRIEHQTVCVGARHWAAGAVGDTILFRARREGNKLKVGYFVHWSTERPWGNNMLSYAVVPALATDAVYSHFMFLLPGVKDYLYGPDDIEGARVEYDTRPDGSLSAASGVADDGTHDLAKLTHDDLVDAKGRTVLVTNVWSHQLGAHGGGAFAAEPNANLKCYGMPGIRRLPDDVARAFRMGDVQKPLRANPAWSAVASSK